jgi:hypothetical protein
MPWHQACQVTLPSGVAARKQSAIRTFASQLTGRGAAGPVLPAGVVAHFTRRHEVLFG